MFDTFCNYIRIFEAIFEYIYYMSASRNLMRCMCLSFTVDVK